MKLYDLCYDLTIPFPAFHKPATHPHTHTHTHINTPKIPQKYLHTDNKITNFKPLNDLQYCNLYITWDCLQVHKSDLHKISFNWPVFKKPNLQND